MLSELKRILGVGMIATVAVSANAQTKVGLRRAEPSIKVQIIETSSALVVRPQGRWNISDKTGAVLAALSGETIHVLSLADGKLQVNNSGGPPPQQVATGDSIVTLSAETTGSVIELGTTPQNFMKYAGSIDLKSTSDSLSAVEKVRLEEYLRGVVPSEIGAGAPAQAMAAQAVAARSFAVLALQSPNHLSEGFDICSTVHCQVYSGLSKATVACDAAVSRTRGVALTYKGKPIPAYYSSMCAGHTEDIRNIWPDRSRESAYHGMARFDGPEDPSVDLTDPENFKRALAEKPAAYCNPEKFTVLDWAGKNFRWTREFTAEQISTFVAKRKDIGRVLEIRPGRRGVSGRLTSLELVGEKGSETVNPEIVIRRLFEPALRSGAFIVESKGPKERPTHFVFSGGGSGHGVGMCQTGAMGMANAGKDFREILKHYYSTADLETLY